MSTRYLQLNDLIDKHRPQRIVEVGVHRGARAALMVGRALLHWRSVEYLGFDVFDTVDAGFHALALNGKGIATQNQATASLSRFHSFGLTHRFVVGDTRTTLHKTKAVADFAFIDGDHRVEVIRGDAEAIDAPVLVFDDYYTPGKAGMTVDLARHGANVVIDEYRARGCLVTVLPAGDVCKHGSVAHLAVVERPA